MREISIRSTVRMWDTYMVRCGNIAIWLLTQSGRRKWLFAVSPLRMCSISGEMVGSVDKDELPRNFDVPPGIAYTGVDRERY